MTITLENFAYHLEWAERLPQGDIVRANILEYLRMFIQDEAKRRNERPTELQDRMPPGYKW